MQLIGGRCCTIDSGWPSCTFRVPAAAALDALKEYPKFMAARELVMKSDVELRGSELRLRRKRDDDWFFARFGLNW